MTLALVVGNLIGSGIYLLPATLAPLGPNQLAGWGITIAGSLCMAYVFARLSARMPLPGGPFAYVMQQFGPAAGFAAAWAYWTMVWSGNGAVAVAVVSNLSLLAPSIGKTPGLPAALAVGAVWVLTLVNIRGVRAAGDVQVVTTVLKLLPLIGLIGLALWLFLSGAPRVEQPPVALAPGLIASAAGLTFWGFLGLESATVPSDKVENASRIVPRATMLRSSPRSAPSARSTASSSCKGRCPGPWRATGCSRAGSARKPRPARRSTRTSSPRCC